MNLFCHAKTDKPGKDQSIKACFSSTGNMSQISDRKHESSRVLEGQKFFSILTMERNRFFGGDFDSVQFPG